MSNYKPPQRAVDSTGFTAPHLDAKLTHRAAAVILNVNHMVGISTETPL